MKALSLISLLLTVSLLFACSSDDEAVVEVPEWTEAFDASDDGWLLNVWGPSDNELYAVGGTPAQGRVVRFDGQDWSVQTLGVDAPLLNWAYGFGADNLFVVGNEGTILRYDGAGWTRSSTVTDQDLWGVWGSSETDVWAVGGNGVPTGEAVILRYDGQQWQQVEIPELRRDGVFAFYKVWGSGPNDVHIVGQNGAIFRWNGTELTEPLVGVSVDLISVWGTGPEQAVAVGGRSNGIVLTWNGRLWSSTSLAPRPGLNGVWMRDPDTAVVVGRSGTILEFNVFERTVIDQSPLGVTEDFHAVFGTGAMGRLTAVGGNFGSTSGPFEGVAYELDLAEDQSNGE